MLYFASWYMLRHNRAAAIYVVSAAGYLVLGWAWLGVVNFLSKARSAANNALRRTSKFK